MDTSEHDPAGFPGASTGDLRSRIAEIDAATPTGGDEAPLDSSRIFRAAPVSQEEIEAHFGDQIREVEEVVWDPEAGRVVARRRRALGALTLQEAPLRDPDPSALGRALLEGVREAGLQALPWTKDTTQLRQRLAFLGERDPDAWPDASEPALEASLDEWLLPFMSGMKRLEDLRRLELVYQYRVDAPEAVDIRLGRQVWTRSGRILDEIMPAERALALEEKVAELGGPGALACVVAETGQGPVAYCPQLVGEQYRWPVGLSLIALAALLLILPELRRVTEAADGRFFRATDVGALESVIDDTVADRLHREVVVDLRLQVVDPFERLLVRPPDDRRQRLPPVGVRQRDVGDVLTRVRPRDRIFEVFEHAPQLVQRHLTGHGLVVRRGRI